MLDVVAEDREESQLGLAVVQRIAKTRGPVFPELFCPIVTIDTGSAIDIHGQRRLPRVAVTIGNQATRGSKATSRPLLTKAALETTEPTTFKL